MFTFIRKKSIFMPDLRTDNLNFMKKSELGGKKSIKN